MRGGIIAGGGAFLVIGGLIYELFPNIVKKCTPIIEKTVGYNSTLSWKCSMIQIMKASTMITGNDPIQATMIVSILLIIGGIGMVAYGALAKASPKKKPETKTEAQTDKQSALDILRSRLAKGEITKEEFDKLKDSL